MPRGKPRSRRRGGRGGGWEYYYYGLPEITQKDLIGYYQRQLAAAKPKGNPAEQAAPGASAELLAKWAAFEAASKKKKVGARERLAVLRAFQVLREQGKSHRDAEFDIEQQFKVSKSAVNKWLNRVEGVEPRDWLAYLVDQRKGRTAVAECTPAAWEAYMADYLRLEEPAAVACYERIKVMAAAQGWVIPSLAAFKRQTKCEVPESQQILARKGKKAAKAIYPAQTRDRSDLHALEGVNADGHTLNVWVKWHDG